MKDFFLHSLILLLVVSGAYLAKKPKESVPDPARCNKTLMDSYDIEGSWDKVKDRNLICPMANKHNCCSYHAQLDIYKKWIMQGEGRKVRELYKTYASAIGKFYQTSNGQILYSTNSRRLKC